MNRVILPCKLFDIYIIHVRFTKECCGQVMRQEI